MAVWKRTVAGSEVKIHDMDHMPPHCHVGLGRKDAKVNLHTLQIINPPPHALPPKLRRRLLDLQPELLEAWELVRVAPPGGSPGVSRGYGADD